MQPPAIVLPVFMPMWQATDMAAPADPRRHQQRVFADQCALADCEMVSTAATDNTQNGLI